MSSIPDSTIDKRELAERQIWDDYKSPRYNTAKYSTKEGFHKPQLWCQEAGDIADDFDTDELMMMAALNRDDALAIGEYVLDKINGAIEEKVGL